MTRDKKYGEQPYEKVIKAEFDLRGVESTRHAAHLQYKLMLLEPVLRVHVDHAKKSMEIEYLDPKYTEKILDTLKPVKASLKSRESGEYDEIVSESYHD